jgi:hypothetical protein
MTLTQTIREKSLAATCCNSNQVIPDFPGRRVTADVPSPSQ